MSPTRQRFDVGVLIKARMETKGCCPPPQARLYAFQEVMEVFRVIKEIFAGSGKGLAWSTRKFAVEVLTVDDGSLVGAMNDASMELVENYARFEKATLVAAADGGEALEARCSD